MAKVLNQPPLYQKDALATSRGWIHPKTGELLISNKSLDLDVIEEQYPKQVKRPPVPLTPEQINDARIDAMMEEDLSVINDVSADVEIEEKTETGLIGSVVNKFKDLVNSKKPEDFVEVEKPNIDDMTKAQLIDYAKETFDVELSKKDNRNALIEKVKELK